MRMNKPCVFMALIWIFLITLAGCVSAAETWVTDIRTGCKIGWISMHSATLTSATWNGPIVDGEAQGKGSFTIVTHQQDGSDLVGEGEGEMLAGLLDGQVVIRWSNGGSFEGKYSKGLKNGKGIYKWANGKTYDGEWVNGEPSGKGLCTSKDGTVYEGEFLMGLMHGQGVIKDANGKILHYGQWKDGKPVVVGPKTDNVLGIPWGASGKTVTGIMSKRPDTKSFGKNKRNDVAIQYTYTTTFNGNFATVLIFLYQDQMYEVEVWIKNKTNNENLGLYATFKQGLMDRYGLPTDERKGKPGLLWALGDEHFLRVGVAEVHGQGPPIPIVCLEYLYKPTYDFVEKTEFSLTLNSTSDF